MKIFLNLLLCLSLGLWHQETDQDSPQDCQQREAEIGATCSNERLQGGGELDHHEGTEPVE